MLRNRTQKRLQKGRELLDGAQKDGSTAERALRPLHPIPIIRSSRLSLHAIRAPHIVGCVLFCARVPACIYFVLMTQDESTDFGPESAGFLYIQIPVLPQYWQRKSGDLQPAEYPADA